jgi:hypothetical protein
MSAATRITQLTFWVLAGAGVYFLCLRLGGMDLRSLWRHAQASE